MRYFYLVTALILTACTNKSATSDQVISKDAEGNTVLTQTMDFETCTQYFFKTVNELNAKYTTIVNTKIVRIYRIKTVDGSILFTCSQPDQKVTVLTSTKK